jgi:ribosomal protein S18 acetylase RimI-like enzyme
MPPRDEVTVRDATPDDVDAMQRLGHAVWPLTYGFAGEEYVRNGLETWWSPEAILHSLQTTITKVAVHGDEVVGVGNLDLAEDPPVIWKLYVLPSAQGSGVGSALVTALLDALPPTHDRLTLEYIDGNEKAAGFYRHLGFRVTGRTPGRTDGEPDQVWAVWTRQREDTSG